MFRSWLRPIGSAVALTTFLLTPAWCQSKYAPIFEKFRRTGDRTTFWKEMAEANRRPTDIHIEVPVLLDVIAATNNNPMVQEEARGRLCGLIYDHRQAYDNPIEREIFRPVISVFESHLNEAQTHEDSKWGVSIAGLTAFLGFPPSPQAQALIYRMLEYRDESAQGVALLALARLRPLSEEAKRALFSRLTKSKGKLSGPEVLGLLAYAIHDSDVLQIFVKSAESSDLREQEIATQTLADLNPIPPAAVEVFRRLQKRDDLGANVEVNVKTAIARIENKPVVENEDRE